MTEVGRLRALRGFRQKIIIKYSMTTCINDFQCQCGKFNVKYEGDCVVGFSKDMSIHSFIDKKMQIEVIL